MIRKAIGSDVPAIVACSQLAYERYVARIGSKPAPMVADFSTHVSCDHVHVIDEGGVVLGYVHAYADGRVTHLDNVAVLPAHAGRGLGRLMIAFVENLAKEHGHDAVELYTNAAMMENLTLYPRLGYVETGRHHEDGFDRVYFRKNLVRRGS